MKHIVSPQPEPPEGSMRESVRGWSPTALRQARRAAGLTQEDLAAEAGCAPSAIGIWESGRYGPQPRHAVALAAALELSIHDLLDIDPADATVRDLRAWVGLTQTDVREALSLRDIGAIERGTRPIPPDVLPRLAELYGVDEATLRTAAERTRAEWRHRIESRKGR
ncbi:MAG: helix-turn-helix domain-containing protein [Nocardioidaceae bacterium]